MAKRSDTSYKIWLAILKIGIALFFVITLYGTITRWTNPPYFSLIQKLLGLAVELVGLGWLFMSQIYIIRLSRTMRISTVFSQEALSNIRRSFLFFLTWTIYCPIQRTLECLIATMHNPVGHRLFALSIGMPDLIRLLVLAILAFFMFVLQRGIDLSEDQSLTI